MKVDRDTLRNLICQHFSQGLQKAVTFTRWKDGIDVDCSTYAIEAFADAIYELGYAAGGKYGWQPDNGGCISTINHSRDGAQPIPLGGQHYIPPQKSET